MNILVAMETKPYQRVWLEEAAPGETFIYKEGKAEREDVQNADIILGNVSPKLISAISSNGCRRTVRAWTGISTAVCRRRPF